MADMVLPQAPPRGRTYLRPRGRGATRGVRYRLIDQALEQGREHGLDVYGRMLLVVLARRADGQTGVAQATRDALAEDVGASVRKIASTIETLVDAGLVEVVNYVRPQGARTPGFGANVYRLTFARGARDAHLAGEEPQDAEGVHDVHGRKEGTTCPPYQPPEEAAIAASSSVIDQKLLREAQRRLGAPIDASLQTLLGQRLVEDEARAMYAVEVANSKRNPGGYLRACLKDEAWLTLGHPPAAALDRAQVDLHNQNEDEVHVEVELETEEERRAREAEEERARAAARAALARLRVGDYSTGSVSAAA